MASVCFYFQVHQPFRIRRYSVFDRDPFYFDNELNERILRKVAEKCYRPATVKILDLVRRHDRRFRVSYAITSTALEQFELWAPDLIGLFQELAETGAVEFVAETSHHSLSFLYAREEFDAQVERHHQRLRELFGTEPTTFRNTELIYSNELAAHIAAQGRYRSILCEGVDALLGFRSPNYLYTPPGSDAVRLLLKNYRLSDDIAFRFSDRNWKEWPLSAERFAHWVNQINGDGFVCNLFMDYETFGEHQWADTGIFEFMADLPRAIFDYKPGENHFNTPSEAFGQFETVGEYDVPHMISWADSERDLSAWLGNAMQTNAISECYKLERPIKNKLREAHQAGEQMAIQHFTHVLEDWRKLTTSDHFYYMSTKFWADGDVHKYFSPYDSPYDSYINFMNVLDNLRTRVETVVGV